MNETPTPKPKPETAKRSLRCRFYRGLVRAMQVALALLVLFVLGLQIRRWMLEGEVETLVAEIRARGEPVTPAELDAWYAYPEGDNAASIYQQAFAAYDESNVVQNLVPVMGTTKWPPAGEPLPKEMRDQIELVLSDNAETLRLLKDAAKIKECRYPIDLTKGNNTALPHLKKVRDCARLLSLQATLDAMDGDSFTATETILRQLRLAESLENEPLLISQLVRVYIHQFALQAAGSSFDRGDFTLEDLDRIQGSFLAIELAPGFRRSMVGERVNFYEMLSSGDVAQYLGRSLFVTKKRNLVLEGIQNSVYRYSSSTAQDTLSTLQCLTGYADAFHLTPKYTCRSCRAIADRLERANAMSLNVLRRDLGIPLLDYEFAGSLYRCSLAYAKAIASLRCGAVACGVETYKLDHGALPESLAELVPEYIEAIPDDPFAGGPLRYVRRDGGYVVYSLGENEIDDGGYNFIRKEQYRLTERFPDVGFAVPRHIERLEPPKEESTK